MFSVDCRWKNKFPGGYISWIVVIFIITSKALLRIIRRKKWQLPSFCSDQQLSGRFAHLPLRTVCRFIECKLVVSRSSATRHRAPLQRPRDQYHRAFIYVVPTEISSSDGKIDRPIYFLAKMVSDRGFFNQASMWLAWRGHANGCKQSPCWSQT